MKKLIAMILLLVICLSCFPMTAMAETPESTEAVVSDESQAFLESLQKLRDDGKYDEAIEQAEAYLKANPSSPVYSEVEKVCIQCYVRKARVMIDNKQREKAWNLLEDCIYQYRNSEHVDIAEKDLKKLKDRLKSELPKSGKIFHDRSTIRGGNGKLTIKNKVDSPRLYKIEKASGSNKGEYITMFVRANSTASVYIQPGKYHLKYATGTTWYSSKEWFGSSTAYYQMDETLDFSKYTYTITSGVANGNLGTTWLAPGEF